MDRRVPNWLTLPLGIFELIVNKLHFVDQVRALAVCKTWRDCKDYVRCSDTLPWVISHRCMPVRVRKSDVHFPLCELFDPYSRNTHQLSNSMLMNVNGNYIPLAAKNGWVWALFVCNDSSKVFLHNPFTNEIRSVYHFPKVDIDLVGATIKGNPASLEYEIFTVRVCVDELRIDIVKRDSYMSDSIVKKLPGKYSIDGVMYFKGYIYCLFHYSTLYRYGLEDGSWDLLTSGFPEPYDNPMGFCYLMEIKEDLIVVRMDDAEDIYTWMIFRFDWSKMSWVIATSLKNCAIYLGGDLAFSSTLKNTRGEILEGCRLCFLDRREFKCYSLTEAGGVEIESEEYGWITKPPGFELSLIEPPYFGI